MLKNFINALDKKFRLRIYPRDRIFLLGEEKPIIDIGGVNNNDMIYYPAFLNWQGNKLLYYFGSFRQNNKYSGRIICNDKIIIKNATSPSPIIVDSRVRLYFFTNSDKEIIKYTESENGYDFNEHQKVFVNCPRDIKIYDGKVTKVNKKFFFYFSGIDLNKNENIYRAESDDGTNFGNFKEIISAKENGFKVANNPHVICHIKEYLMAFRASKKTALFSQIYLASSDNGFDFKIKEKPIVEYNFERGVHGAAFPYLLKKENSLQLYYAAYWGKCLLEKRILKQWIKS